MSQVVGLLILMSFSGPFNLASGGFLAASPLISNCLNLPFGTQGRSWRLEYCLQETGDREASMPGSPTGSCSVSLSTWKTPCPTFYMSGNFSPPSCLSLNITSLEGSFSTKQFSITLPLSFSPLSFLALITGCKVFICLCNRSFSKTYKMCKMEYYFSIVEPKPSRESPF